MARQIVDTRGQPCPKPLMMTKKAWMEAAEGEEITVILDNATSCQNVSRFLTDNGMSPTLQRDGELWTLTFTKRSNALAHPEASAYCIPGRTGQVVFCFRSDTMGRGDDELGAVLMKACINTLGNVSPLPSALVFYNRGVFLVLKDSPVIESLRELESKGVRILACGTCLDYFQQKHNVGVGTVSNMYDILETLVSAGHVVYP